MICKNIEFHDENDFALMKIILAWFYGRQIDKRKGHWPINQCVDVRKILEFRMWTFSLDDTEIDEFSKPHEMHTQ